MLVTVMKKLLLIIASFGLAFADVAPKATPTMKLFYMVGEKAYANGNFIAVSKNITQAGSELNDKKAQIIADKKAEETAEIKKKKEKFMVVIEEPSDPKVKSYFKRLNSHQMEYYKKLQNRKDSYFGNLSNQKILSE